jgi:hypothetical protein
MNTRKDVQIDMVGKSRQKPWTERNRKMGDRGIEHDGRINVQDAHDREEGPSGRLLRRVNGPRKSDSRRFERMKHYTHKNGPWKHKKTWSLV